MFIIFHDCTHGSFFKNKKANAVVGTITGILTLFAYEKWKREHAIHHASSGNLDKRGIAQSAAAQISRMGEGLVPLGTLFVSVDEKDVGCGRSHVFLIVQQICFACSIRSRF